MPPVLPWVLVALYASLVAHELGHALLARLAGYRVSACGAGLGAPFLRLRLAGTVYYAAPRRPLVGLTFSLPTHAGMGRAGRVALLTGGLVAHAAILVASGLACLGREMSPMARDAAWAFAWVNGALLVLNAVPMRMRMGRAAVESDAWQILHALRGARGAPPPLGARLRLYRESLGHLEAVGDRVGATWYATELALAELECGRLERARDLLERPVPADCPRYVAGRFALARAELEYLSGDAGARDQALARAREAFASDPSATPSVELAAVELAVLPGAPDEAAALGEAARRAAALGGWARGVARDLEGRARRLAGDDRPRDDDPAWVRAWLAGRAHARMGRLELALPEYERALSSFAREMAGLDEVERRGFLERQERLVLDVVALGAIGEAALARAIAAPAREPTPIDGPYGVLGLALVVVALAIQVVQSFVALSGADLELRLGLAQIAGACAIAGLGGAVIGLASPERKRLAWIALAVGLPVALGGAALVRHLSRAVRHQSRAAPSPYTVEMELAGAPSPPPGGSRT